jgi:hypothetical protein
LHTPKKGEQIAQTIKAAFASSYAHLKHKTQAAFKPPVLNEAPFVPIWRGGWKNIGGRIGGRRQEQGVGRGQE